MENGDNKNKKIMWYPWIKARKYNNKNLHFM